MQPSVETSFVDAPARVHVQTHKPTRPRRMQWVAALLDRNCSLGRVCDAGQWWIHVRGIGE
jgi:hypothetical protein